MPAGISGDWANYVRGAVLAPQQSYDLRKRINAVALGTMPIGGLGSSAAVGGAYAGVDKALVGTGDNNRVAGCRKAARLPR